MSFKKITAITLLGLALSTSAIAMDGVTGNIGFTSDYVFRGVSQSDEAMAIQGGFDYEHETGIHAGVWGSSIDFNNPKDGSMELDLYAGYQNEIGAFSYDVGGIYYAYPGAASSLNYDFWEAYISAGYDFEKFAVSGSVNYSPEFFGDTGDATYYAVGLDVPLPHEFALSAHYGYQDIDQGDDYYEWSVGVSRTWLEFDWALNYHDTDIDNNNLADDRVVLSVGKTF